MGAFLITAVFFGQCLFVNAGYYRPALLINRKIRHLNAPWSSHKNDSEGYAN